MKCSWKQFSGATLLFEHSPSRANEIDYFDIFSRPRENKVTRRFFLRFKNRSEVFCKKGVLKISQNLPEPARPATLFKKRLLQVVELRETSKGTFFNRTSLAGCFWSFLLSWSFLHFILKWQDCKNFTKLVPSDFFLGFTKLYPKAVTRMCSIRKLFLEILEIHWKTFVLESLF